MTDGIQIPEESVFNSRFGELSTLAWGAFDAEHTIVAAHGWLDNAASFHRLAPLIIQNLPGFRFISVDLPGHGKSPWLGGAADYHIWNHSQALFDVIGQISGSVHLLAHSMGAGAGSLLAGSGSVNLNSFVSLDALGPIALPAEEVRTSFSRALAQTPPKGGGSHPGYADIETAVGARIRGNLTGPGLDAADIKPVVVRNLREQSGRYFWRADPMLRSPSPMRISLDVLSSFLQSIQSPSLVLMADQGIQHSDIVQERFKLLPDATLNYLPGHHHFHLEVQSAVEVAATISEFYVKCIER